MKKEINEQIRTGFSPIHLKSVLKVNDKKKDLVISKYRVSKNNHTKHLQIGIIYKSVI